MPCFQTRTIGLSFKPENKGRLQAAMDQLGMRGTIEQQADGTLYIVTRSAQDEQLAAKLPQTYGILAVQEVQRISGWQTSQVETKGTSMFLTLSRPR